MIEHKVLVVEDDLVVRTWIQDALEEAGYGVVTATDWPEVQQALRTDQLSAAVVDLKLLGVSGDRIAYLVANSPGHPPAVVLHSAVHEAQLERIGKEVGAIAAIPKGTGFRALIKAVERACSDWCRRSGQA